jgi:hypothetical protein
MRHCRPPHAATLRANDSSPCAPQPERRAWLNRVALTSFRARTATPRTTDLDWEGGEGVLVGRYPQLAPPRRGAAKPQARTAAAEDTLADRPRENLEPRTTPPRKNSVEQREKLREDSLGHTPNRVALVMKRAPVHLNAAREDVGIAPRWRVLERLERNPERQRHLIAQQ